MRSYRKFWPNDRIARVDQMKIEARKKGLTIRLIDAGIRMAPMFYIRFRRQGAVVAQFFDITEAEQWVAAQVAA